MASETISLKNNILTKIFFFRFAIFLLLLFWCFGFSYTSFFNTQSSIIFKPLLKNFYSTVCHQQSEKTMVIFGSGLLVCARCTGIYLGSLLSCFILLANYKSIKIKLNKRFLYISILPIILDVIFYLTGIYPYSKVIGFLTGLFFGAVITVFIFESLEEIIIKKNFIK